MIIISMIEMMIMMKEGNRIVDKNGNTYMSNDD